MNYRPVSEPSGGRLNSAMDSTPEGGRVGFGINVSSRSWKSCKLWGKASLDWTCLSNTPHRCSTELISVESEAQLNTLDLSQLSQFVLLKEGTFSHFSIILSWCSGVHWWPFWQKTGVSVDILTAVQLHVQQTATRCVFWHVSIRTSININQCELQ